MTEWITWQADARERVAHGGAPYPYVRWSRYGRTHYVRAFDYQSVVTCCGLTAEAPRASLAWHMRTELCTECEGFATAVLA